MDPQPPGGSSFSRFTERRLK